LGSFSRAARDPQPPLPLDGATLFSKLDSNKLRFNVKNEMTLIYVKFDADLINISKVTSRKIK